MTNYTADRTALLIVDPCSDFMREGGKFYEATRAMAEAVGFFSEGMHAAHEINGPRFAHAILITEDLAAQVGTDTADAR